MHNRAPAPFIFDDLECAPQGHPLSLLTTFAASSPKGTPEPSQSRLTACQTPPFVAADIFPRPGEVYPLRGSFIRVDRMQKAPPFGGAGERSEPESFSLSSPFHLAAALVKGQSAAAAQGDKAQCA